MQTFFNELGNTVLKRWKSENFSLASFPAIAKKALDERPPAKRVDLSALIRDFLLAEDQPAQTDSDFGEPEIVVFNHPRFYIQLLFWMDGTTAIHQHEFSGAFHVMHGSSIHAHYDFEKPVSITPYLRTGNIRLKKMELLAAGRSVEIVSGRETIHSLFHLDSPSVTVVVRTQHDPGTGPQFNYLAPHLAIDPHFSDKLMMRRKQLLDVLAEAEADDDGYLDLVTEMISDLDFERGFSTLHHCMETLQHLGGWEEVLRIFQKKHGALAAGVPATLKEDARRNAIKAMRGTVIDPEHRFFLAGLMNAPGRAELLALVTQRFPKKTAIEIVLRWAGELVEVTEEGVYILDAKVPETLGAELELQPGLFLAAFEYFLKRVKKLPPGLPKLSAIDLQELRVAFAESALSVLL